jgi:hypothetical protein
MHRLRPILFAALAVAALPGCDFLGGVDDDRSDAEIIVGTWDASAVNVLVDVGPFNVPIPVAGLETDEQWFDFGGDGQFTFVLDPDDDRRLAIAYEGTTYVDIELPDGPVELTGDYEVQEEAGAILFSTIPGQTGDDFTMDYDIRGNRSVLELQANDPRAMGLLLGLAGEDYQAFAQYVAGGSITYDRRTL